MFHEYPYTDFHEANLDWFLNKFKSILAEWEAQKIEFADLKEAWAALKKWVEDYFDNLDVQNEINEKLDVMAADGTLSALISPFITNNANPIFVASVDDMSNHNKTYVLTGTGHIYTYRNGAFTDTGMTYSFNSREYIKTNHEYINNAYMEAHPDTNVTNLPINTFYRIGLNAENALTLGLTANMPTYGSLYIIIPTTNDVTTQGWKALEYIGSNGVNTKKYFAFMFDGDTIETIVWHEVIDNYNAETEVLNKTVLCDFGVSLNNDYFDANPDVNILNLDVNRFYRVGTLSDVYLSKLGFLKEMQRPGNLYIRKPWNRPNPPLAYKEFEYVTGNNYTTTKYIALLYGGETLDNITWRRVEVAGNKDITDMCRNTNKIYLIGDSIVEGYGGSNYNGGSVEAHSSEEIPNNVKTWYRNTAGYCWANLFKDYIESNYQNTTVVNNGIGGLTCAQVHDNFDNLVGSDATMVIIGCGTNNINSTNKHNDITVPIANMVTKCLHRGLKCVILTNTPTRSSRVKPNNGQTINGYILNAIKLTSCDNVTVLGDMMSYLDMNDMSVNDVTYDSIHPNDAGYKLMFNIIRKQLGL